MAEQSTVGNGRRMIEYRSVITLGNLLNILTIVMSVCGALMWWYGDVEARLATLETKMAFAQTALSAMASKMGIELSEFSGDGRPRHNAR